MPWVVSAESGQIHARVSISNHRNFYLRIALADVTPQACVALGPAQIGKFKLKSGGTEFEMDAKDFPVRRGPRHRAGAGPHWNGHTVCSYN